MALDLASRTSARDLAAPAAAPPPTLEVTPPPRWREALAAPVVALVTLVVALIATDAAGIRFRDPDNVAAGYVAMVGVAIVLLVAVDIFLRARRLEGGRRPSRAAFRAVRRTRWTGARIAATCAAFLSFYIAYLAYRNLKGLLPFLRPGDLFDGQLIDLERAMFLGQEPWALLHSLLGTGISAHVLSTFYAAFIVFLPLSLAIALVFSRNVSTSLFFATALSLNWLIGAGSYFVLPALGPVYADPAAFAALPYTEVTRLQAMLLEDRVGFLANPETGTPQAIAAFASLHIAMSFTALAAAHMLRLGRRLKIALWAWLFVTTVATIYLGWHYVVDDVAGILIGGLSLWLARLMTGYRVPPARGPAAAERAVRRAPEPVLARR